MKTLYLIGGPMGVGKTSVARELNRVLPASVMLDGDWCWAAEPFTVTNETKELVLDNISHMLRNFLACGAYENVILCWVMHEQGIIDDILRCVAPDPTEVEVRVISLVCDASELVARIHADVDAGLRDEGSVNRALAYLPLYEGLRSECIDTTASSPAEVAVRIARPRPVNQDCRS